MESKNSLILQKCVFTFWFFYTIFSSIYTYNSWVINGDYEYAILNLYYLTFTPGILLFCLVCLFSLKTTVERNKMYFFIPVWWIYSLILYTSNPSEVGSVWGNFIRIMIFCIPMGLTFVWLKRRDKNVLSAANKKDKNNKL